MCGLGPIACKPGPCQTPGGCSIRHRGDTRRPTSADVAEQANAATAACLDAAPTLRTMATLATSSGSLTPTVSGPPRAPAGDREAAPYDNEVGDANASSVPAHTTNFWRAHLGISLPSSADADEEAGDEGLLPTQRSALYAALAELRPRARIRMFAGLRMFLAALVQDVALVMDAVSDRDGRAEQVADEDTAEDGESEALEVDDEAALMQMMSLHHDAGVCQLCPAGPPRCPAVRGGPGHAHLPWRLHGPEQ